MKLARHTAAAAAAAVVGSASPAFAVDVPCGQPEPGGTEPTRATLVLDTTRTQNNPLQFGSSTGDKGFHLVYTVAGCALKDASGLRFRVHADHDVAAAIDAPEVTAERSLLFVDLNVRATFPTGSATPLLTIGGDAVVPVAQPLAMQRKEAPLRPLAITLLAALIGGGIAIYTSYLAAADKRRRDQEIVWRKRHAVAAIGAGLAATLAVYLSSYGTADTFTLDVVSGLTLFVAAATAAAGGAKAGAGSAVAVAKRVARARRRAATPVGV